MAALGHRQIPLKLLGLRLGLTFISSLSFILFLGFGAFFFFFQKQRGKIGLIKACVTEDWDLQAYGDLHYLKHPFDLMELNSLI